MTAPVDVLAVMDALANYAEKTGAPARHAPMLREARAAVAELIDTAGPLVASLLARIDADNAMTPQAVMVRQAAAAIARVKGVQS